MAIAYPPVDPYRTGMLDVGDGNEIYWETCGNPDGKPALVLHGGPGSGCTTGMRRLFDPRAYRIVLVDQRGAGRSTPHAADPSTDLSANTTVHLTDGQSAQGTHVVIATGTKARHLDVRADDRLHYVRRIADVDRLEGDLSAMPTGGAIGIIGGGLSCDAASVSEP